jgi:hypothetical protein
MAKAISAMATTNLRFIFSNPFRDWICIPVEVRSDPEFGLRDGCFGRFGAFFGTGHAKLQLYKSRAEVLESFTDL